MIDHKRRISVNDEMGGDGIDSAKLCFAKARSFASRYAVSNEFLVISKIGHLFLKCERTR